MKKFLASLLAITLLLLAAIPVVSAATNVNVSINGKKASFQDSQPYIKGSTLMLPVRTTAEQLGLVVSFSRVGNEIRLTAPDTEVAFQAGNSKATNKKNGKTISFGTASIEKKGRVFVPIAFFSDVLGYTATYDAAKATALISSTSYELTALVNQALALFTKGSYQQLSDQYFDDTLKKQLTVAALSSAWEQISANAGSFKALKTFGWEADSSNNIFITAVAAFEKIDIKLNLVVNSSMKLTGILLGLIPQELPLPSEVTEEETIVGEGTAYPLGGTLTLPNNPSGKLPAVILVQGSGASDRDETAGGYKPFRDIAWGLAQQGIAVLRYDKRTYAYASSFTPESAASFTIKDESVDDAIAAAKLLKADPRIDSSRVYIIGHSQGGMLAPRIDAEGGDFAGIVSLAGSPRSLWEIIYDQNKALIATMDDSDPAKKATSELLEAEYAKAKASISLSDEEAKKTTAFGISAYYFKEMDTHSTSAYAAKLTKPILVLQGEDDFQVYANKDYVEWQKLFSGKSNASFKLYPGLNHFFVNYDGPGAGTLDEYVYPGLVSAEVIADIGKWILAN